MKITLFNTQKDLKISKSVIQRALISALYFKKIECDEVVVHLVTDLKMRRLHKEFFNDDTSTDCISFPFDADSKTGYKILGEIFICPKTALDYVKKKGGNAEKEVILYLIHGFLHLIGYDDLNGKEKKKMRAEEKKLLQHMKL